MPVTQVDPQGEASDAVGRLDVVDRELYQLLGAFLVHTDREVAAADRRGQ
jgi:hypothetical protein